MAVIWGGTGAAINGIYVGGTQALAAYLGATQVWSPGPQRIAVAQWASGPMNGNTTTRSMTTPTFDVKAGDLMVVASSTPDGYGGTKVIADTAGNTWAVNFQANGHAEMYSAHAIAAADYTGNSVTLSFPSNIYGCLTVTVYRAPPGKTWSFDSAHFSIPAEVYTGSPLALSLTTSGAGVVNVYYHNGDTTFGYNANQTGVCTGAAIQAECPGNSGAAHGYMSFTADVFAAAALSGYAVTCDTPINGVTSMMNRDVIVAPFTYA